MKMDKMLMIKMKMKKKKFGRIDLIFEFSELGYMTIFMKI